MFLGYIDPGAGWTIYSAGGWIIALLVSFFGILFLYFKRIFGFLKRHYRIASIILTIIVIGLAINTVIMNKKEAEFDKKIIILGFDGLSPEIMEPMLEDEELPNFSRLKGVGSYRRLSTTNPPQSPVAWAGFATGKNPGKNGVFDFIVRDPKTYKISLSLSDTDKGNPERVIKTKCFWQYTSERKIPTVILTCPMTFPPDRLYGRMLSGMGVPDILGTEGTFTFYTTEALNREKDIGGNVFYIKESPIMEMNLIGPRVSTDIGTNPLNVKVPFKVSMEKGKDGVVIEYQNKKFPLKAREWSNWQGVEFKLGLFKKIKGIFKFYLVEKNPEFRLYISPINFDPEEPFFPISYPKSYSKELAKRIGLYHTRGMPFDTWSVNERRITEGPFLEEANEILKEKKAMLNFELNRFKRGVLFCYFEDPDIIQHIFWRYIDPEHPLYEKDGYGDTIRVWYKKMDDILGSVMKKINKEDILIVLSDHGFRTFRRAVHINSWLRENGYLELKNPDAGSGRELLEDIDWTKTRAYSLGFGAIYINQKGRERDGVVKRGEETKMLKEELIQKLKGWIDEKYNVHIINHIYTKEGIFWGEYADDAPDLYIGFNTGYRASWQSAIGGVPERLIEDNLKKWSGDHLFDPSLVPGVIFSNRVIAEVNPSVYDITPTILKIVGYEEEKLKGCNLDGEPLW